MFICNTIKIILLILIIIPIILTRDNTLIPVYRMDISSKHVQRLWLVLSIILINSTFMKLWHVWLFSHSSATVQPISFIWKHSMHVPARPKRNTEDVYDLYVFLRMIEDPTERLTEWGGWEREPRRERICFWENN